MPPSPFTDQFLRKAYIQGLMSLWICGPWALSSFSSELEFLKSLWWLGTEEEQGYRTGPPGYQAGGIHSLESIPGPHKHLKHGLRHRGKRRNRDTHGLWLRPPVLLHCCLRRPRYWRPHGPRIRPPHPCHSRGSNYCNFLVNFYFIFASFFFKYLSQHCSMFIPETQRVIKNTSLTLARVQKNVFCYFCNQDFFVIFKRKCESIFFFKIFPMCSL